MGIDEKYFPDVIVITHEDLRSDEQEEDPWEDRLIEQKSAQGYSVGILTIENGTSADDIKDWLEEEAYGSKFVYIIGAAHDWYFDPDQYEPEEQYPFRSARNQDNYGNFVPFYATIEEHNIPGWTTPRPVYNDTRYVENIEGCGIGRLPARNIDDIDNYLAKADDYIYQTASSWTRRVSLLQHNVYYNSNSCKPWRVEETMDILENRDIPGTWTTYRLETDGVSAQDRHEDFEDEVNNGRGLMVGLGTGARQDFLTGFYWYPGEDWGDGYADFSNFTNEGDYSFYVGPSCEVGSIQYWKVEDTEDDSSCNILQSLLLLEDAGFIGALVPTDWTVQEACFAYSRVAVHKITAANGGRFGNLVLQINESAKNAYSYSNWDIEIFNYFGDPTIRYPVDWFTPSNTTITQNTTWDDAVVFLDQTITVAQGVTLTIAAGTEIIMDDTATPIKLVINGTLNAEGELDNPILFHSIDPDVKWGGIEFLSVSSTPNNLVQHCLISDAEVGVNNYSIFGPNDRISHTRFANCEISFKTNGKAAKVDSCIFVYGDNGIVDLNSTTPTTNSLYIGNDFASLDYAIFASYAKPDIQDTRITDCLYDGIYMEHCDEAIMEDVEVSMCEQSGIHLIYTDTYNFSYVNATENTCEGLLLKNSSGTIEFSQFNENTTAGVVCLNSSPTFSNCNFIENTLDGLSCLGTSQPSLMIENHFFDNEGYQFSTSFDFFPYANNGYNNVYVTNNNRLLTYMSSSSPPYDYSCKNNYWGSESINPNTLFHQYNTNGFINYNYSPNLSTPVDNGINFLSYEIDSLEAGFEAEIEGDHEEAARLFYWVLTNSDNIDEQSIALLHWSSQEFLDSTDWESRIDTLESLENLLNAEGGLAMGFEDLIARANVGIINHEEAIEHYTDRMEEAETFLDSAIAEVQISTIYIDWAGGLELPNEGFGFKEGKDDKEEIDRESLQLQLSYIDPVQGSGDFMPVDKPSHNKRVRELLNLLQKSIGDRNEQSLPTEFRLAHPYPNPFNPTVVLNYDLPKTARVEILIYNILGQRVISLLDRPMNAGRYSKLWHGTDQSGVPVASGMYFVSMKADKFHAVRKVVLLK